MQKDIIRILEADMIEKLMNASGYIRYRTKSIRAEPILYSINKKKIKSTEGGKGQW